MMLKRMIVAMRMKRSHERYRAHQCPACAGPLAWTPTAPGAREGKACPACGVAWTDELTCFGRVAYWGNLA
jgi:hypothetical protein